MYKCPICNREMVDSNTENFVWGLLPKWCADCLAAWKVFTLNYYYTEGSSRIAAEWAANRAKEFEQKEILALQKEIKRLKKIVNSRPCQICDIGDFRASCTCKEKE